MSTITSADGTTIDYESYGDGPAVVFVAGAVQHRALDGSTTSAARLLGEQGFTAVVYDRRGRGRSPDTRPWTLGREVEDLAAIIADVGGAATVYSSSSGATVALAAALATPSVTGLVLYEPPFFHGAGKSDQISAVAGLLARGDDEAAMRYNLTDVVGIPEPVVDGMSKGPTWAAMCAAAPTLIYDLTAVDEVNTDPDWAARWAEISVPTTVVSGSKTFPGLADAADQVATAVPAARRRTLPGEDHSPSPDAIVDAVVHHHASVAD